MTLTLSDNAHINVEFGIMSMTLTTSIVIDMNCCPYQAFVVARARWNVTVATHNPMTWQESVAAKILSEVVNVLTTVDIAAPGKPYTLFQAMSGSFVHAPMLTYLTEERFAT